MKKKGPFSTKYDPDKLRELINEGKNAKEIMKELKIARYTLNEHLLMLQRQDKKIYNIEGLFDFSEERKQKNKVRKYEGIYISPKVLEQSELEPGDTYEVSIEKGKIILKKRSENKE
ncbi:MAG: AbrB/MazE/SpoVT family DNA-binding domain-containing protein [Desulfobacteraceae bacterium]|nr:AbrB/MazE/SpoVT family DNA-binding domain-containing protein [Desulfobacteraceae bacterium]